MLLRTRTELPNDLKLATEEFREGWDFAPSVDARRLEKRIVTQGWSFIKIAGGPLKSGVGDTSQEAIGNALKLALRHISVRFNAVDGVIWGRRRRGWHGVRGCAPSYGSAIQRKYRRPATTQAPAAHRPSHPPWLRPSTPQARSTTSPPLPKAWPSPSGCCWSRLARLSNRVASPRFQFTTSPTLPTA